MAVLFVLKFKVIIIASIVGFTIYYYTKYIAHKKCDDSFLRAGVIRTDIDPAYVFFHCISYFPTIIGINIDNYISFVFLQILQF